jgi:hypothetical protein
MQSNLQGSSLGLAYLAYKFPLWETNTFLVEMAILKFQISSRHKKNYFAKSMLQVKTIELYFITIYCRCQMNKKQAKNDPMNLSITGWAIGIFVDAVFALVGDLKSLKANAVLGEGFKTSWDL